MTSSIPIDFIHKHTPVTRYSLSFDIVGMGRGGKCTTIEDFQLARPWIVVSEDPIRGNEVKSQTFWGDIFSHYQAAMPGSSRTQTALMNRWSEINKSVQQFAGGMANPLQNQQNPRCFMK